MGRYVFAGTRASMDTTNGVLAVWTVTSGLRRFRVLDIMFGCDGTPGDTAMTLRVNRSTAAATAGTSISAGTKLDDADGTSTATGMHGTLTNGTNSGTLLEWAQNQRSTVRWFAAPGEELVVPATNLAGLHFLTPVAPALQGRVTAVIEE